MNTMITILILLTPIMLIAAIIDIKDKWKQSNDVESFLKRLFISESESRHD